MVAWVPSMREESTASWVVIGEMQDPGVGDGGERPVVARHRRDGRADQRDERRPVETIFGREAPLVIVNRGHQPSPEIQPGSASNQRGMSGPRAGSPGSAGVSPATRRRRGFFGHGIGSAS